MGSRFAIPIENGQRLRLLVVLAFVLSLWTFLRYETETSHQIVASVGERVVHLPEDAKAWHLSVFTGDDYKTTLDDRELLAAIETDEICRSLKAQTHYHHYTRGSLMYRSKWTAAIPETPTILLQDGTGKVVYKASRQAVPTSPRALGDQLAAAIDAYRTGRPFADGAFNSDKLIGDKIIGGKISTELKGQCGPGPCPRPQPNLGPFQPGPYQPPTNGIPNVTGRQPRLIDGFRGLWPSLDLGDSRSSTLVVALVIGGLVLFFTRTR